LTIGNPKIDYGELFGYDLDPENLQPGMKIWRMDHLMPIELTNPKLFGQFHSNDSYIILHVSERTPLYSNLPSLGLSRVHLFYFDFLFVVCLQHMVFFSIVTR